MNRNDPMIHRLRFGVAMDTVAVRTASTKPRRWMGMWVVLVISVFGMHKVLAQAPARSRERLALDHAKSGESTLNAFQSVSRATRRSVVKIDLDGSTVALGMAIDDQGLVLTKASELASGRLTCWLPSGKEVSARLLTSDDRNDVALLRVASKELKAVSWAAQPAKVGQWVVTPGVSELPQAVGIVSVPPRRILHPRALMGVQMDRKASMARVESVLDGMPAKEFGIRAGDVFLQLNGTALADSDDLIRTLREFREGESVTLRVKRGEEEFEKTIPLKTPKNDAGSQGLDRSERMNRMGSTPSNRSEGFELVIQHDSVLQNWQCGGPLVNLEGKVVGLNIARAGRVASYALPSSLLRPLLDRLKVQAKKADTNTTGSNLLPTSTLEPKRNPKSPRTF